MASKKGAKKTVDEASVSRALAAGRPAWVGALPSTKPRAGEPALLGEVLPPLFRAGFPHLRFAGDETGDPTAEAQAMLTDWPTPATLLRPASVWSRFARAYAGSALTLTSDPARRRLTPEGAAALARGEPIGGDEVRALVRRFLTVPGTPRIHERHEDFVYALELSLGPTAVAEAIVEVLETPPKGAPAPQLARLIDVVGVGLGFLRLRMPLAARRTLDERLRALVDAPKRRFPFPRVAVRAFLEPGRPPAGSLRLPVDYLHTEDGPAIAAVIAGIDLRTSPTYLPDPRLPFLGGEPAIVAYLARFPDYQRHLHPSTRAAHLRAFVDGIGPFLDARVTEFLARHERDGVVGEDARAWLALRA